MSGEMSHRDPACCGYWRMVPGEDRIRCDRCAMTYRRTPERRLAAIDENYAGIYLRRLTADGRRMLDAERRTP